MLGTRCFVGISKNGFHKWQTPLHPYLPFMRVESSIPPHPNQHVFFSFFSFVLNSDHACGHMVVSCSGLGWPFLGDWHLFLCSLSRCASCWKSLQALCLSLNSVAVLSLGFLDVLSHPSVTEKQLQPMESLSVSGSLVPGEENEVLLKSLDGN